MNRTVIQIGQNTWVRCGDYDYGYWAKLTNEEVAAALDCLEYRAEESNVRDMAGHFDNWNLDGVTREDRRFKRIARELEGNY